MSTALGLARAFGARLHALTCLDERAVQDEHIRQMLEEHARERELAFEKRCADAGVACQSDMEAGDPRAALVHLARKADLLAFADAASRILDWSPAVVMVCR